MAKKSVVEKQLLHLNAKYVALSATETAELNARWSEVFLEPHARGAELPAFRWEVLATTGFPCLSQDEARNRYRAQDRDSVLVLSDDAKAPVFLVTGQLPSFEQKFADAYVCPKDFAWTMAFSHEGYGPYFTTAEWVAHGRTT